MRLAPGASERAVIDALDRLLEPYGGMSAHGRDEQLSHRILSQEINQWKVIGTLIPSIFLAVAAFLLNVVLSRQVATQREQIAALKALGYANGAIAAHYLLQVVCIVLLGIGIGVGVGSWLGGARHARSTPSSSTSRRYRFFMPLWVALAAASVDARRRRRRRAGRRAQGGDAGTRRGDAPARARPLRPDAARARWASAACSRRRCGWWCATWSAARCARC